MIGLRRGKVRLFLHHPRWKYLFEIEKKRILKKAGAFIIDIQHIGSTAVPGLSAKPIIDMSIGVRRLKDAKELKSHLHALGYQFDRSFQHQLFFAKGPDSKRTHYLHVMRYKGAKWQNDKLFRDYLQTHLSRAKAYDVLKKKLARLYPEERQKYSDGKDAFIKRTIELAKRR